MRHTTLLPRRTLRPSVYRRGSSAPGGSGRRVPAAAPERFILCLVLASILAICGCATKPTTRYPFPRFVDPVTEEVPHVKHSW